MYYINVRNILYKKGFEKMDELRENTNAVDSTTTVMTNLQWENFAKSDLVNFMVNHGLQKVTADDGAGKKATAKINSKGEYLVSYTTSETL